MTSSTLDQHQQDDPGKALAVTPAKLPIKAKPPLPPKVDWISIKAQSYTSI